MKTFLALLPYCCCYVLPAQTLTYPAAHPYLGMDAYGSQLTAFSFTGNQAALAQLRKAGIGIYGERRFMLAANSSYVIAGVFPTRLGNLGLQLNYAGFKNYNTYRLGLAYARSLGRRADLGIQFGYYGYRVPGYGQAYSLQIEGGVLIHLTDQLHFGLHVHDPVHGKAGKNGKTGSVSVYKAGMGYAASRQFYAACEIIKEEDRRVNVVATMQYRFSGILFASGGFSSATSTPFISAGVGWHDLRLDLSVSHHPQLGFSPGLLLLFQPHKEQ